MVDCSSTPYYAPSRDDSDHRTSEPVPTTSTLQGGEWAWNEEMFNRVAPQLGVEPWVA